MSNSRPTVLSILLVLSFISAIWNVVNTSLDLATFDISSEAVQEQIGRYEDRAKMVESDMPLYDYIFDYLRQESEAKAQYLHFLLGGFILFAIVELIALTKMWKLQRNGFYLYAASVLLTASWPLLLSGASTYALFFLAVNGFFSLLFIGLYSTQLKHLK